MGTKQGLNSILEAGGVSGTFIAGAGTFGYFSVDAFKEVLRSVPLHSVASQPDFWSAIYCAATAAVCVVAAYMSAKRS